MSNVLRSYTKTSGGSSIVGPMVTSSARRVYVTRIWYSIITPLGFDGGCHRSTILPTTCAFEGASGSAKYNWKKIHYCATAETAFLTNYSKDWFTTHSLQYYCKHRQTTRVCMNVPVLHTPKHVQTYTHPCTYLRTHMHTCTHTRTRKHVVPTL